MIWQKQRFIIVWFFFGISFIVYLLNSLIERKTAAVWCNIYLKHVFGTCYLISLLFRFMALENLYLQNSPRQFALVSCFELPKQTQNELRNG